MHVLPEWVTIVLLIVYYSNGLFSVKYFGAFKRALSTIWMTAWIILFIASEAGLFITALLTAKNPEIVFIISLVVVVISIPFLGYALSKVVREKSE